MILAVGIGAFGAHGLAPFMDETGKSIFQTASKYHFFHGLAMWIVLLLGLHFKTAKFTLAFWHFLAGITLFSGSLYLLALKAHLTTGIVQLLGPVTPLGGALLLAGWVILTLRLFRHLKDH